MFTDVLATIGEAGAGTVTVDGPGSTWTHDGTTRISIGNIGSGQLIILNGGQVSDTTGARIGGAIGAITGAVVILGARTVFGQSWTPDFTKVAFVIVTLLLLLKFKKLSEPLIILVAAALSLIVYPLIHP
jgi:T5SS/PEP-CTERM-associated repeat protein